MQLCPTILCVVDTEIIFMFSSIGYRVCWGIVSWKECTLWISSLLRLPWLGLGIFGNVWFVVILLLALFLKFKLNSTSLALSLSVNKLIINTWLIPYTMYVLPTYMPWPYIFINSLVCIVFLNLDFFFFLQFKTNQNVTFYGYVGLSTIEQTTKLGNVLK